MAKAIPPPRPRKTRASSGKGRRRASSGSETPSVRPELSFPIVAIGASARGLAAFTALLKTIREALVVVDSEYRVLTVNRSFCDLFQVSLQDMEHQSFFGLGAGQCNVPRLRELLQDVLSKSTEIKDFEVDQDFPRIGRRRLVLNASRIEASKTLLIAVEDFTERKQAQEEAEKGQSTIRALLDSSAQSVVAVNADEKIVLVNGNTEKMFGYHREELLGQPLEILVPEGARERHVEHHRVYFANMQSRPMGIGLNLEGRRKDGTTFRSRLA